MSLPETESVRVFGPPAGKPGMVSYRGELAQPAYQLNRFLTWISRRENREAFLSDEEGAMVSWPVPESQRPLIRRRDYAGLLSAGVNVYVIAKAGYVFGDTLMEIGSRLRDRQQGTA